MQLSERRSPTQMISFSLLLHNLTLFVPVKKMNIINVYFMKKILKWFKNFLVFDFFPNPCLNKKKLFGVFMRFFRCTLCNECPGWNQALYRHLLLWVVHFGWYERICFFIHSLVLFRHCIRFCNKLIMCIIWGRQTLGEEYCDIIQVSEKTMTPLNYKVFFIFLSQWKSIFVSSFIST